MEETRCGLAQDGSPLRRAKRCLVDDPQGFRIANGKGVIRTQHDFLGSGNIANGM
jgi:hypothetical protein